MVSLATIKKDPAYKKELVVWITLIAILLVALYGAESYRSQTVNDSARRNSEQKSYSEFIEKHHQELRQYEEVTRLARPIRKEEIDQVQNYLIQKMAASGVELKTMTAIGPGNATTKGPDGKPVLPSGIEYEASCVSSWESIRQYLNTIRSGQVLINIRNVRMEIGTDGALKTTFKYKIYTE